MKDYLVGRFLEPDEYEGLSRLVARDEYVPFYTYTQSPWDAWRIDQSQTTTATTYSATIDYDALKRWHSDSQWQPDTETVLRRWNLDSQWQPYTETVSIKPTCQRYDCANHMYCSVGDDKVTPCSNCAHNGYGTGMLSNYVRSTQLEGGVVYTRR